MVWREAMELWRLWEWVGEVPKRGKPGVEGVVGVSIGEL